MMKYRILLALCLSFFCSTTFAATSIAKEGESLSYTLFFNWKFVWINAGHAQLSTRSTTYQKQKALQTTLVAHTTKAADAIFHLNDTLTTIVTPDLQPRYFMKHSEEGKDHIHEYAWFSHTNDGKHQVKLKKVYTDGHIRENEYTESRIIYDMISLLNYARTFNMENLHTDQRLSYPMVSGRWLEEQTLIYKGKQSIEELNGNKTKCHIFSLVKKEKDSTTETEIIRFYISEDTDRVPVQLDLFLKFGVAKARLSR